jgi:6-phospho-beta-glucosidase
LCNVAIGFERSFAQTLGVRPAEVTLDHVGLNHLTWIRGVQVGGRDVLPQLLADSADELADRVGLPARLVRELGAVPSYYLRYYYCHDVVVAEQRAHGTRAAEVAAIERELLAMYADPTVDAKPELLERRGGAYYSEAAVDLVASLRGDRGDVQVVNVRNDGTLPFLPDEAVVEVPCRVGAAGALPLPVRPLEPLYAGLVAHVSAYEELALDAALHGGRDRVVRALVAHPLVGQLDLAEGLADRLLAENAAFLPWAAAA